PVERTTRWGGGDGTSGAAGSTTGAGAFSATGTFSGSGVGGGAGSGPGSPATGPRRRPFESAPRRAPSAPGASVLRQWLFTPILSSLARSSTTAFSTPSSLASS